MKNMVQQWLGRRMAGFFAFLVILAHPARAETVVVNMVNFTFSPPVVRIAAGDTVTWIQRDATIHTTTSGTNAVPDGWWDSGPLAPNVSTSFSFTFELPGVYPYFCRFHTALMRGTVLVEPNPIREPIAKGDLRIELETVVDGLISPLGMAEPDDGSGRLFIYDQAGLVYVLAGGRLLDEPLLDVRPRLVDLGAFGPGTYDERGLLGLAVHPLFATNRLIYTYTSEPVVGRGDFSTLIPLDRSFNHQSVVAEWRIDPANSNRVEAGSRRELFRVDQPQFNHNGGVMRFGPEGYLYIAFGDGGGADDQEGQLFNGQPMIGHAPAGNGQNVATLYGSIARIDVDGTNALNGRYGIPEDSFFHGIIGLPEIYAFGFRNPYSFSFDPVTEQLYAGDTGENWVEEIDIVVNGGNYGWNHKEGSFFFDPLDFERTGIPVFDPVGQVPDNVRDPIAEYDHDEGRAVVGGYVYRGRNLPLLSGRYVFGDYQYGTNQYGRLFYLDSDAKIKEFRLGPDDRHLDIYLKGFGQDRQGEVYVFGSETAGPFGLTGRMLKIVSELAPLQITGMSIQAGDLILSWSGGNGPYVVQRTSGLVNPEWVTAGTFQTRSATIPLDQASGFFRVAIPEESQ